MLQMQQFGVSRPPREGTIMARHARCKKSRASGRERRAPASTGEPLQEGPATFEPVFESLKKATDATVKVQQELFNKWTTMFPALPMVPAAFEPMKFQKRCLEVITELTNKQRESLEAQFNTGVKTIEEAFRLCESKGPEELR